MSYEKKQSRIKFTHESASAVVQLDSNRVGFLMDVFSSQKRQGHATGLLSEIINWADEAQITLELVPMTYDRDHDSDGLTDAQLIDFYKKFGFVLDPNSSMFMHRPITQ